MPRWRITLRPGEYEPERIGLIGDARRIVEPAQIRRTGWPYPVVLRPEAYSGAGNN